MSTHPPALPTAPTRRRQLVLSGSRGTFIVLWLTKPTADRVQQRQYQVDLGPGGTLRCVFSRTHDLLFLLLEREVRWGCEAAGPGQGGACPCLDGARLWSR